METLMLFSASELPIPVSISFEKPSWRAKVVSLSRKAVKEWIAKAQLSIFDLLNKPAVKEQTKRKRKPKQRSLGWEDAPTFMGSITITQKRLETDQSDVLTDWSSASLWELHRGLFEESLEALKAGDNAEEKMDVLEWIFSPSYIEKAVKTNQGRPCLIRRHASDIPFSFVNCCRAVGISDPDTFRELLVDQMDDELRPKLEKYLHITQGKRPNNCLTAERF